MLIAHVSDVHVGAARYREGLLRTAIAEINTADPDLVVVAGDITDDGYPDQYPIAKDELSAIACGQVVFVPGNHDARNVRDTWGSRTPSATATLHQTASGRSGRGGRGSGFLQTRLGRGRDRPRALRLASR